MSTVLRVGRALAFAFVAGCVLSFAYYAHAVVEARRATPEIIAALLESDAIRLELSDFPPGWLDAILAVEDPAFYEHNGIDLRSPGAGLTTITQAMVKYLYFERFQSGIAKIEQTLIATLALDALVEKDVQLLIFVNTVGLGSENGRAVRGYGSAAEVYFGKDFGALSMDEFLALVAMPIAPTVFHTTRRPESNARRVERIKRLLSGDYVPVGLMDQYYGSLTEEEQRDVAPFSYFPPE